MTPESNVLDALSPEFDTFQSSFFRSFSDECSSDEEMCKNTDRILKGFTLPLTPPITPACSPLSSPVSDFTDREQPFCDQGLDDEPEICEDTSIYSQEEELKHILIKDCMWSGSSFEKSNSEKHRVPNQFDRVRLLCQTPPLGDLNSRILSVDPSEIFPFPLNGEPEDRGSLQPGVEHSDSEEEVEVDVVTIEKAVKREPKAKVTNESDENLPPTVENSDLPITSPDVSGAEDGEDERTSLTGKIRVKRRRKSFSEEIGLHLRQRCKESKTGSNSSAGESDESENDSDFTRASHNVLERKRRNDLKLKFQRLRDSVPELKDNERAPKVSILRKSWEHIKRIKEQEKKLQAELEHQKKRNANLLKRLLELNQPPH